MIAPDLYVSNARFSTTNETSILFLSKKNLINPNHFEIPIRTQLDTKIDLPQNALIHHFGITSGV